MRVQILLLVCVIALTHGLKCPVCEKKGEDSFVFPMGTIKSEFYTYEEYNLEGKLHSKDYNFVQKHYGCSYGHKFVIQTNATDTVMCVYQDRDEYNSLPEFLNGGPVKLDYSCISLFKKVHCICGGDITNSKGEAEFYKEWAPCESGDCSEVDIACLNPLYCNTIYGESLLF